MLDDPTTGLLSAFALSPYGRQACVVGKRVRTGRSTSALLELADGRRVFVKHGLPADRSLFRKEAQVLTSFESCESVAGLCPRLIGCDFNQVLLVTEWLGGYAPFDVKLSTNSMRDPSLSAFVASALAAIHHRKLGETQELEVPFPLPDRDPLTQDEYSRLPADYAKLSMCLWRVNAELQRLRTSWRTSTFIHGDFKAGNLMWSVYPNEKAAAPLAVVDWELAGYGDLLWDVGSYVGSLIDLWVNQFGDNFPRRSAAFEDSLPFQRQIGYFLITYHGLRTKEIGRRSPFTRSSLRYAGVYLLHRVWKELSLCGRIGALGWLRIEMAEALINETERIGGILLPGLG